MCHEVLVRSKSDGESYCETVGQLAQALGMPASLVSSDPDDYCLCNFDASYLAARKATISDGYPFPAFIIDTA